jgi:hypothetical protein
MDLDLGRQNPVGASASAYDTSSGDGEGYPKSDTQWIFILLGIRALVNFCIFVPVGLLIDTSSTRRIYEYIV